MTRTMKDVIKANVDAHPLTGYADITANVNDAPYRRVCSNLWATAAKGSKAAHKRTRHVCR